jgi:S-adenosylmethionine synthetase
VVLSTQHAPDIELPALREAVIEEIIKPVLPADLIKGDTSSSSTRPAAS